jgi:phosphoribosylformylglycinamidine cyclo-ligase
LFFLDYFATGHLHSEVAEAVLRGIVEGCKQAKCALVGGETAEMPDFYTKGEYDLAGFAVGLVDSNKVLPQKQIRPGDILIGISSSGCHSNGYSLLRKLIPQGRSGDKLARELLTPTKIYVKSLSPLLRSRKLKGLAHITGSGFLNVPRMSEAVSYEIQLPGEDELPPIFKWVKSRSELSLAELAQTFNLGIGMVGVVSAKNASEVLRQLKRSGEKAWEIGGVVKSQAKTGSQVHLRSEGQAVSLRY